MTKSFVGFASAESSSLTLPGGLMAGDLICVCAYRHADTTVPTMPSGWLKFFESNQASRAHVFAFKNAASASEVSGTWTNAQLLACAVWRDSENYLSLGSFTQSTNTSATVLYNDTDTLNSSPQRESSWVGGLYLGLSNSTDGQTPPTGMVNRGYIAGASTGKIAIHDTNSNVIWGTQSVVMTGSTTQRSLAFEIYDTKIAKASGSGPYRPMQSPVFGGGRA